MTLCRVIRDVRIGDIYLVTGSLVTVDAATLRSYRYALEPVVDSSVTGSGAEYSTRVMWADRRGRCSPPSR